MSCLRRNLYHPSIHTALFFVMRCSYHHVILIPVLIIVVTLTYIDVSSPRHFVCERNFFESLIEIRCIHSINVMCTMCKWILYPLDIVCCFFCTIASHETRPGTIRQKRVFLNSTIDFIFFPLIFFFFIFSVYIVISIHSFSVQTFILLQ